MMHKHLHALSGVSLAVVMLCVVQTGLTQGGGSFPIPSDLGKAIWKAEKARAKGDWAKISHPWASGAAYVTPGALRGQTVLEFPFELARPAVLRIRPLWWRHGERKSAKRFPHPLPSAWGPDVMDWCGRLLFFTCPASGRVCALDAESESIAHVIDVGGYPSDIVADRKAGKVYVADAQGDRVVALDAKTGRTLMTMRVPECPWSLALHEGKLYAACKKAKCVAVIDPARHAVTARLPTGAEPVHVEIVGRDRPRLAVRVMAKTFDLETFDEMPPDKDRYEFRSRSNYDAMGAWYRVARIHSPEPGLLRVDMRKLMRAKDMPKAWRNRPRENWTIDVASVTGLPEKPRRLPHPMQWKPGIGAIDAYPRMQEKRTPTGARTYCPGENVLLFTAPAAGKVGWVDLDEPKGVKAIDLGGYPIDIVVDQDSAKAYVADALGNRVVVLNAKDGARLGEIKVAGKPWSLDVCNGMLFVACRQSKSLVVTDTVRNRIVRKTTLGAEPLQVRVQYEKMIRSPNISKPDRVAVKLPVVAFDMATLKKPEFVAEVAKTSGRPPRRANRGPNSARIRLQRRVSSIDNPEASGSLILRRTSADGIPERFTRRHKARMNWTLQRRRDLPAAEETPGLAAAWGFWRSEADAKQFGKKHVNVTASKTDIFGYALGFNGRNALVDCGADPAFMPTEALTVEAWVRWDGPGRSGKGDKDDPMSCIVGNRGINAGYMLMIRHDGRALFNINGLRRGQDADLAMVASGQSIERGRWAHIVGVYESDGPTMSVYVNGAATTNVGGKRLHASASRLAIGAQKANGPYYWFKGSVAQVRIHSRALDGLAILARYEQLATGKTKTFSADNLLTLRVDGVRWLDMTRVADPQMGVGRPLSQRDKPGTITLSVDDGPQHDWTQDIWLAPGQSVFLQNGTEEYWRWNAPAFQLKPGRHVLKVRAHSPFACLDGLEVSASHGEAPSLRVLPVPSDNWNVFYHNEPVRFRVMVLAPRTDLRKTKLIYTVENYMGERVAAGALEPTGERLEFKLKDTGRFTLTTTVQSPGQEIVKQTYFMRLPKLEHPRLLFRRDEMPEIRKRIAKYPRLFRRFTDYLRRHCDEDDFLPTGVTIDATGIDRNYLLGWRALACQFAAVFFDRSGDRFFASKVAHLLEQQPPYYDMAHFHQGLFPGAATALLDMAAMNDPKAYERMYSFLHARLGNGNVLPQGLAVIDEPLVSDERAILSRIMMWMFNIERYFNAHAGKRGGNWWVNAWTGCHCPLNGPGLAFFYLRSFLGEKRNFEKTHFRGFFTHHRYLSPCMMKKWAGLGCGGPAGCPPSRGLPGPQGTPSKWIMSVLGKQPMMIQSSGWKDWVRKMNGKLDGSERKAVDALFDKDVAVVIPIALALGWLDPDVPSADMSEFPPTALFDGEGDVSMRAGGKKDGTSIYFTSGARDVVYRNQPNHFQIYRGPEPLIGTGSLWADDVNSVPAWGNVVVVADEWHDKWRMNVGVDHFRADERIIINRYAPAFRAYALRDQRLTMYRPARGGVSFRIGWSALGFHQHQEDLFLKEGDIAAYETWPEFDYVVGDATNAWPLGEVEEAYRQLVFVKPDVIVVYDRVRLGRDGKQTRWLAATQPDLTIESNTFRVRGASSALCGTVLLPRKAPLKAIDPRKSVIYRGLFYGPRQKVLEIHSPSSRREVEYLVVMRVGAKNVAPLLPKPIADRRHAGAELALDRKKVRLTFRRSGPIGGHITIIGGPRRIDHDLVEKVDDSYRHWRTDPRHKRWMSDARFRCVVQN